MLDVHHYFSKMKRNLAVASIGLLLGACSSVGSDMVALNGPSSVGHSAQASQIAQPAAAKPSAMAKFVKQAVTVPQGNALNASVVQQVTPNMRRQRKSQWCKYLDNDAAARATILRAPTVSGDINDDGRKSATVSYDVMDIARARLIENTAEAKCRRYQANAALNRIVTIAPTNLTRAGFAEKAKVISSRAGNLKAIKTLVQRELKTGNIDRSQATSLSLAVDNVLSDGAIAASESAKRQGSLAFDIKNVGNLAAQLFKAERDLADINSNIRSADAVSVNLEGGWREGVVQSGVRIQQNSMFGGVKVSVKLGAFNPARKQYERQAARARANALRTEPGSIFWKIGELISAHQSSRAGLVSSRNQLIGSRQNAQRLKVTLPVGDPTYIARRYKTEIEIIRLDSEIAAVKASIRQLDRNLSKLQLLRYRP